MWDADFNDLARDLQESGLIKSTAMVRLRNSVGHERLGVNVTAKIERRLAAAGIKHWPERLSTDNKDRVVHLWHQDSLAEEVLSITRKMVKSRYSNQSWRKLINELVDDRAKASVAREFYEKLAETE